MACLSVLGCKNTHRSTGSYVLLVLMIAGIALALRILLYALARWLQRWQQSGQLHDSTAEEGGEVEMQGGQPVLHGNTQQCRRMPPLHSCHRQNKCVAHVCGRHYNSTS